MQPFRQLLVWQKADALSARVDDLSGRIARGDRRLGQQLREAAASTSATIAEGACGDQKGLRPLRGHGHLFVQ